VFGTTLYFSDAYHDVVVARDLTTNTEQIYAGTLDSQGFSGDSGPATSAELNQPRPLAVDGNGNLFVADGDLLHRSGPRFVDGVEMLCAMLERARVNRDGNR